MALQLSAPQTITANVVEYRITSFSADLETNTIFVAYDRIDDAGNTVSEGMLTIPPSEFLTAVGEADAAYAQAGSVYGAIKASLYARIQSAEGVSGSIV